MATNFPTSVDVFTNPVSNDSLNSPSHSTQHANANDAIEAVEDYLLNGNGRAGLQHINTTTFSSGTSVQINSVFSSTFDNYLVQFSNVKCSVAANTYVRLSVSATPATGSNYQNAQIYWSTSTLNGVFSTDTIFPVGGAGTTDNSGLSSVITLTNPAKALPTCFHIQSHGNNTANVLNGVHQISTAYDGLYFAGGTFTSGTIRIFGYRNS